MISMLIALLVKLITILGIGALAAMVVYVAILTLKWVFEKIKAFLTKKFGGTVTVMATQKLVQEIVKEKQRTNDITSLDELEKELQAKGVLDKEGIVMINSDKDGNVRQEDIKFVTADTLDENLKGRLDNAEDGVLVIGTPRTA